MTILKPIEGELAALAIAELDAHKTELLAMAQNAGVKAIDAVIALISQNLPSSGLDAIASNFIKAALAKAEPKLVAAFGSETEVIYAALRDRISAIAQELTS